ncbi:MAG: cyclase family protein [Acidobacteria bacterium]|nr:cyclase family protein [Acidobacteriota bacterium]MBS1865057.1 cyclase family protein [Acidobacteriota bacterium]
MPNLQRHTLLISCAFAFCLVSCTRPTLPQKTDTLEGIASGKTRVIDLSYAINDKLVAWPGDPKVFEAKVNGTVEKDGYFTRSFWMLEHYGTHLDAPAHFPPGKSTVEQIAPEKFFGPAVVLDIRADAEKNADYQLSPAVIDAWEKKHGRIPAGAIVILRTGWTSRWPDVQRYRNTDTKGEMHFPGFSVDAAKILLDRKISGLGCDTLSIDPGNSKDFPVHHLVLGADVYQLENLRDLTNVPEAGAFLVVAPIKLEGGSGGAVRVFALDSHP